MNSIFKKSMFLKVKGNKFNRPVKACGSTLRFDARSECGHQPNSPARLSLTTVGGGTTPLCYIKQPKRRIKMAALMLPFSTEAATEVKTNTCTDRRRPTYL